jgi:3-oxoacyl-[acyl-carrier-protein] synthase-3
MIQVVITGTGSCIPEVRVNNEYFLHKEFYDKNGSKLYQNSNATISKFSEITGIEERRYALPDQNASDLGYMAAQQAITNANVDKETIDYIIVAHNFGDVPTDSNRSNQVPTLASRIKALLAIKNPNCVAYDLPFGCPGWVEGIIQAKYFIQSGDAKKCLVIGTETLSRIIDPYDRDSMIFSDGAGAAMVEASSSPTSGIRAHKSQTYALGYIETLNMDTSYSPFDENKNNVYLKMAGRKVYEFAITHVPALIRDVLDKSGKRIEDVKKVLIHQANEKMDYAILERVFQLYGMKNFPKEIMPMTIQKLGNSSVATVPTLLDLLFRGQLENHHVEKGDVIILASVGAGMNINAIVYEM